MSGGYGRSNINSSLGYTIPVAMEIDTSLFVHD